LQLAYFCHLFNVVPTERRRLLLRQMFRDILATLSRGTSCPFMYVAGRYDVIFADNATEKTLAV